MDDLRERMGNDLEEFVDCVGTGSAACDNSKYALEIAELILEEILTTHTITPIREPVHGTIYTYTRKKCRCDECREANAAYSREYRAGLRREAGKHG